MSFSNKREGEQDNKGKSDLEVKSLVLHNDNLNTFDHVTRVLQKVCNHDKIQAEQCAWITHNNGTCEIKRGSHAELEVLRQLLAQSSLEVTID